MMQHEQYQTAATCFLRASLLEPQDSDNYRLKEQQATAHHLQQLADTDANAESRTRYLLQAANLFQQAGDWRKTAECLAEGNPAHVAMAARIELKMLRFEKAEALLNSLAEAERRRVIDRTTAEHPDITALIDDAGMRYSTIAPYLKNLRHGV